MSAAVIALIAGYFAFERLVSDAATRLAYQIRNQSLLMRVSGETTRTFVHEPSSWPDGINGAYRIEIKPRYLLVGHSGTSYHLNYVEVPADLEVAHQAGEPTLVTLEIRDGKVLLTSLK